MLIDPKTYVFSVGERRILKSALLRFERQSRKMAKGCRKEWTVDTHMSNAAIAEDLLDKLDW